MAIKLLLGNPALAAIVLGLSLLSGCANLPAQQNLTSLPLPTQGPCCWQALQTLNITYQQKTYTLNAALANSAQGLSLVLFDPLGRRMLSLVRQPNGHINSYRAPELPSTIPEHFLLASSLLVWWPMADWQALLGQSSPWQLAIQGQSRVLSYRGKPIMRAQYPANTSALTQGINAAVATANTPVTLQHLQQPLQLRITTNRFDAL